MPEIIEKVNYLDEMIGKVIQLQFNTQMNLDRLSVDVRRTELSVANLSKEMRDFKSEMKDFKDEMKDFKIHTQSTVDKLSQELKADREKFTRELNKKFEKLTKMMGTIVEDVVIPNIEWIAEKYFNLTHGLVLPRPKIYNKIDRAKQKEFDTLAVYTDKIIWVSAKLNAKNEYAKEFYEEIRAEELFNYFPEYKEKEIIPIFASFHIPDNVLTYLTSHKIYAMGSKEDTMDILNPELLG